MIINDRVPYVLFCGGLSNIRFHDSCWLLFGNSKLIANVQFSTNRPSNRPSNEENSQKKILKNYYVYLRDLVISINAKFVRLAECGYQSNIWHISARCILFNHQRHPIILAFYKTLNFKCIINICSN